MKLFNYEKHVIIVYHDGDEDLFFLTECIFHKVFLVDSVSCFVYIHMYVHKYTQTHTYILYIHTILYSFYFFILEVKFFLYFLTKL